MAEACSPDIALADENDGNTDAKQNATPEQKSAVENPTSSEIQGGVPKSKTSKKKKNKKKSGDGPNAACTETQDAQPAPVNASTILQLKKAMEQLMASEKPARTRTEAKQKRYEFWETQPVPGIGMK